MKHKISIVSEVKIKKITSEQKISMCHISYNLSNIRELR